MSETREILRRGLGGYAPPTDGFERVLRRRDQRRRNQRVAAGTLGVSVFLGLALALAGVVTHESAREPADRTDPFGERGLRRWSDVWLFDVASGERVSGLESGAVLSGLAVSPDRTRVAYISSEPSGPDLVYVADIDGSNVRPYSETRSPEGPKTPSWSPDGTTIVYQAKGLFPDIGDLFLLDVASGDVRQLIDLPSRSGDLPPLSPSFDPEGGSVLFALPTSTSPASLDLWSVSVGGGDPVLVRRNTGLVDASPVTGKISFVDVVSIADGEFSTGDLWISNPDGSDAERLVRGSVSLSRWSPDGRRILYADERLDALMVLDLAGGETVQLPAEADLSDWLDDGTLVVDGSP